MSNFTIMKEKMTENFERLCELGSNLIFELAVDKDEMWNLYLDSFPKGYNNIYRERREYDCSCCRQFIRNIGGTVVIDENYDIHTLFGFDPGSDEFRPVMKALDTYVKSKSITDIYLNDSHKVGCDRNREMLPRGEVKTWEHLYLELPRECVSPRKDIASRKGIFRDKRNVFKRSLDEISIEAIDIVLELISSNTLYRGEEWKRAIETFKCYKEEYMSISEDKKDKYAWKKTFEAGPIVAKIRNHSIGVLLVDISEGADLDTAVKRYENIVAPANYKRPKAIFTKRMLEDAKKTVTELGYIDSLPRRYATLDDITVNNILFSNRDAAKRISGNVFDDMLSDIHVKPLSRVEVVSIDTFVNAILPTVKEMELLLENKHASNMVSLIAPVNKEAPSMFKWDNSFCWAYSGNIADSDIRERVKMAGGNVDGVLRFSIQWNDGEEWDQNDLDAHCYEPNGSHIHFAEMRSFNTGGFLDVDNRLPNPKVPAVENIAYPSKNLMIPGEYVFCVHQYCNRGGRGGFSAEIEFDGRIYKYYYPKEVSQGELIKVATVTLDRKGNFSIKHHLAEACSTRDIWGVKSNTFVPVTVMMMSPNYWDGQKGVGNKHYFFMLKDCINPEQPNGFYNEFLKQNLVGNHKRVFEALGSKLAVVEAEDQLSGVGFSSTKRGDVTVKVKGASERVIKIKF